jgi:unsaturated rhamnogalacturonyl hydrolase
MWFSLFVALLLVVLVFVGVDAWVHFNTWQSRIKIGRYSSKEDWYLQLKKCSRKWLIKTPVIKLTDNNRMMLWDMLRGNYMRDAIQHWQEASLLLGLSQTYRYDNDPKTREAIEKFISSKISEQGTFYSPIKESDGVILGYALLQCPLVKPEKLRPAFDQLWELIQSLVGPDGTVSYKSHTHDFRFVDTVGFISPFLIDYGQKFHVQAAIDLGIRQLAAYTQFGLKHPEFIPCHTYLTDSKMPVGLVGWGRGLGWYAIGLIDSYEALDASHPEKQLLGEWVKQFAEMAVQFQRKNGSWGWIVMHPGARSDSSTTATLVWFLTRVNHLAMAADYTNAIQRAMGYLQSVTQRNGAVDFSQGDTKGVGVHSQEFSILPFTQGFVLRTLVNEM